MTLAYVPRAYVPRASVPRASIIDLTLDNDRTYRFVDGLVLERKFPRGEARFTFDNAIVEERLVASVIESREE